MVTQTLLEAGKIAANNGQAHLAAVIRIFSEASPLLANYPFKTITGMALGYNIQGALPGVAFRGVNEAYTPSIGVLNPATEALKIVGGEITVDTAIVKTMGQETRATHVEMQLTAMAQKIGYTLIKGNSSSSAKEFDGLERRLTGAQVISNSAASDGAALSLAKFDEALDQCEKCTHILMLKKHRRRLTQLLRDSASIQTTRDEFGKQVMTYDGKTILLADDFGDTAALTEDEAYTGGGTSDGSSIYFLRLEENYLNGIQSSPMEATDLGVLQATPAYGTRVEWIVAQALFHPRAASRLRNIDAALAAIA